MAHLNYYYLPIANASAGTNLQIQLKIVSAIKTKVTRAQHRRPAKSGAVHRVEGSKPRLLLPKLPTS